MSLQKHTFKMLKCHFTQEEMTEFRDKLANSIMDLSSIEDEKKSVMSDYTAKINEKKAMINRVASNIRNGYEHREVKCLIEYDFTRRVKTFFRDDTGEQVQEEIITAEEAQIEIPGLEPIGRDAFIAEGQALIDELGDSIEGEADQDNNKMMYVKCRNAYKCDKAALCAHGTPHEITDHCNEVTECHDIQPSCKAWCEICEVDDYALDDETITSDPCDLPEPPCGGRCSFDEPDDEDGDMFFINGDDYLGAMIDAYTADFGRTIIRAFEDRLNQLQRAAGVEPVVGKVHDKLIVGFSSLTKKDITAICKAVSKADPGIGIIHTSIVEQWPKMRERFEQLLEAEQQERETEN